MVYSHAIVSLTHMIMELGIGLSSPATGIYMSTEVRWMFRAASVVLA